MKLKLIQSILAAALVAVAVTGCELYRRPPDGEVVVSGAPPPPPAEVDMQTPLPGPDYAWIEGTWVWGPDNRWEWEKGHWEHRPYATAMWKAAHYDFRNGRHIFIRGEWQ